MAENLETHQGAGDKGDNHSSKVLATGTSVPSQFEHGRSTGATKPRKLGSYKMNLHDDNSDSWVTSIKVLKDGRRLIVDYNNYKVKLFSHTMNILSSVKLSSYPWDVTMFNDQEAIVTTTGQQIVLVQILDSKLSVKRMVKLSFAPYGIIKYKDKLIVTAPWEEPASVNLIDTEGKVYWSVSTDAQGHPLFIRPWYMSNLDGHMKLSILVTDAKKDTITLLNGETGKIITRRQVEGKLSRGVTTDAGSTCSIFVCYFSTKEVAILSADLSTERLLLSSQDMCGSPQAIAYDEMSDQLIISYWYDDKVETFQL